MVSMQDHAGKDDGKGRLNREKQQCNDDKIGECGKQRRGYYKDREAGKSKS